MKAKPAQTLSVSLTPQQAARIQSAVDDGTYASDNEAVQDALRLWEDHRDLELRHLKRAYEEGLASGEGQEIDRTAFLKGLKAERAARG